VQCISISESQQTSLRQCSPDCRPFTFLWFFNCAVDHDEADSKIKCTPLQHTKDRLRVKLVIDITNLTQPHLDEEDVRGHQIKDKGDKVILNLDTSAQTTHANVFHRKDEKSM